jgi:hypothetical protein
MAIKRLDILRIDNEFGELFQLSGGSIFIVFDGEWNGTYSKE